jgi:hypothetical protein
MIRHAAALVALSALVVPASMAGEYDQPYAIVEAGDRSQAREEFPPAITQIDGKSTRNPRRSDPIAPGKHRITVRFETGRVTQSPDEVSREIELDLAPCTLYRIAARRKCITWEPQVYPEPIGECARKFGKKPS